MITLKHTSLTSLSRLAITKDDPEHAVNIHVSIESCDVLGK